MAEMIPKSPAENTPYSERHIFDRLKNDPDTQSWIVLHSLGLSKTNIRPCGEIDFVILIPGKGVVCLEVKGGEVSCRDGTWYTKNSKTGEVHKINKSPYLQAREGMFELSARIKAKLHHRENRNCPFSFAVVFPGVDSPPKSVEVEDWEVFDRINLESSISNLIISNIGKSSKKLTNTLEISEINVAYLKSIKDFLRPDFERVLSKAATICQTEQQLVTLTEEQYRYLDATEDNKNVLVTGAAGTGKTLLAIEYLRRNPNKKILLLCFNNTISDWMKNIVKEENLSNVDVDTFHSFVLKAIMNSPYHDEFMAERDRVEKSILFDEIYPLYGESALSEKPPLYDVLIIDEAQDLINENNLKVLNCVLNGGLSSGTWMIFGDFHRQAIYNIQKNITFERYLEALNHYIPNYTKLSLKLNCRNTKKIGEETALLSGFSSLPYRLNSIEGLPVDIRYYKNEEEQIQKLGDVLTDLESSGIKPEDVVILSYKNLEFSNVNNLSKKITDIRDIKGNAKNVLLYSTIYSFKGMESKVVIVTDIDEVDSDKMRSLLYVAMSRARSKLILVLNNKIRKSIPDLIKKKLNEEWGGHVRGI
jgi:hypothetical protein